LEDIYGYGYESDTLTLIQSGLWIISDGYKSLKGIYIGIEKILIDFDSGIQDQDDILSIRDP
jgi:hypothetical protein